MTLGKGFFGVLLGCTLSFLLVVGLQATGRDSPSKMQAKTKFRKVNLFQWEEGIGFHRQAKLFAMNLIFIHLSMSNRWVGGGGGEDRA